MADSKQDESFKVVDRRLFTEQGELRKEVVEQERREEELAAKKAAAAPTPPPAPPTPMKMTVTPPSGILSTEPPSQPAPGVEPEAEAEEEQPSHSFQMLVDFLTRNAAAMLGGMADPRTGQAFLDLEGAREMIDMLDTLREKTRGNLAKTDEELLVEVIGSLKLTYMEIAKAASERMKEKAGGKR